MGLIDETTLGTVITKKTVLVVDDQPVTRTELRRMLARYYNVPLACNDDEALELLNSLYIDAVILNIFMSEIDGCRLLRQLNNSPELSDIPVIAIIDNGNNKSAEIKALNSGAQDVISLPLHQDIVLRRIENLLAQQDALIAAQRNKGKYDEITGLLTKEAFMAEARRLISTHQPGSYIISCLDVDNFKVVNDRFGHSEGDRLLKFIADIQRDPIYNAGGLTCRVTADVFLNMLPKDDKISSAITPAFFDTLRGYDLPVAINVHIGRYVVDDIHTDINLMIDRATLALKTIKGSVDTREVFFNEEMRKSLLDQQVLIDEMGPALKNGQFILYFQPQFNYSTGEMIGAEALVRWEHPDKGLIAPGNFIPLFERNGFITALDKYVIEQACVYLRKWDDMGMPLLPVSVNISRNDIRNMDLPEFLQYLVNKYHIAPDLLHIEITESAYTDQPLELIKTVETIQRLGFNVEMDDFGTGYSSLNILKDVPIDVLKLDMRFNSDAGEHSRGGRILSSIVRMAHWLDLPVIAEGVESKQQADYLKSIGCFLMQGYLFSRPLPADEYQQLLTQNHTASQRFQISTTNVKGAADFLDASTQSTLLFNSFVGGAQIIEYDGIHVEALRINERFYEELNCLPDDYLPSRHNILSRFYPESQKEYLNALDTAIKTGNETQCELHTMPVVQGGDELWTLARFRFLAQNVNRYVFYVSVENITDRKKLEIRKQELANELTGIISSVPSGIVKFMVKDGKWKTEFISQGLVNMLGYSHSQLTAMLNEDYSFNVHPDDKARVIQLSSQAVKNCEGFTSQYRLRRKNGSYIWVHVIESFTPSHDGSFIIYSSVSDVTAAREIDETLKTENERNRLLLENNKLAVFDYDIDKDILNLQADFNSRGQLTRTINGFQKQIHSGDFVDPDYAQTVSDAIYAANKSPISGRFDYKTKLWYEEYSWCRIRYSSIANDSNHVNRIIGIISDIREEKQRDEVRQQLAGQSEQNDVLAYEPTIIADIFAYLFDAIDINQAINHVLGVIGEYYHVSRVYIFESTSDDNLYSNTYEWCAEGIMPQAHKLQNVNYDRLFNGNYQKNFSQRGLFVLNDINQLPDDQRNYLVKQDIQAMLQWTIKNYGRFSGFVGFDDCVSKRQWTQNEINTLSILSGLLGLYLYKKYKDDSEILSEDFITALNGNSSYIYIINPEDHGIIFANKALEARFGRVEPGSPCFRLAGRDSLCEICPIKSFKEKGKTVALEYLRPDGIWLLTQASPIHWNGRHMYMVTFYDISWQKGLSDSSLSGISRLETLDENKRLVQILAKQSQKYIVIYDFVTDTFKPLNETINIMNNILPLHPSPSDYFNNDIIAPESFDDVMECYRNLKAGNAENNVRFRAKAIDGSWRWMRASLSTIFSDAGTPLYAVATFDDITNTYEMELAFKRYEEMVSTAGSERQYYIDFDMTRDSMERCSDSLMQPDFEFTADQGFTKCIESIAHNLIHDTNKQGFIKFFAKERLLGDFAKGKSSDKIDLLVEYPGKARPLYVRASYQMIVDPYSSDTRILISFQLIDKEKRAEIALITRAEMDSVTGIYNRITFISKVKELISSEKTDCLYAFAMVDIDHFKSVNDTFGHIAGDNVLHSFAKTLRTLIFKDDLAGRLGGDEFGIFLGAFPDTDTLRSKLVILINALSRDLGKNVRISASIGVALFPKDGVTFEELYIKADTALYEAKRTGRNKYEFYSREMPCQIQETMLTPID